MRIKYLTFLLAVFGFSTQAEVTSNFSLTSDYIWRGQTQTNHEAAVQGGLDYGHSSGLSVGTWLSNVAAPGVTEIDVYGAYSYSFTDNFAASLGATHYSYTRAGGTDTFEVNLGFEIYMFEVSANHTDNYFGSDSASQYYLISASHQLFAEEHGINLGVSVGFTTFEDDAKSGSKNYMDYKIAISQQKDEYDVGIFYTDTDRKDSSDVEQDDHAVGVMISREFGG